MLTGCVYFAKSKHSLSIELAAWRAPYVKTLYNKIDRQQQKAERQNSRTESDKSRLKLQVAKTSFSILAMRLKFQLTAKLMEVDHIVTTS